MANYQASHIDDQITTMDQPDIRDYLFSEDLRGLITTTPAHPHMDSYHVPQAHPDRGSVFPLTGQYHFPHFYPGEAASPDDPTVVSALVKIIAQKDAQITAKDSQIAALQTIAGGDRSRITNFKEKMKAKKELKMTLRAANKRIAQLGMVGDAHAKALEHSQETLAQSEEALEESQKAVLRQQKAVAGLQAEVTKAEELRDAVKRDRDYWKEMTISGRSALTAHVDERTTLLEKNDEFKASIHDLETKISNMEIDHEEVKKKARQTLEKKNEDLRVKVRDLQAKFNTQTQLAASKDSQHQPPARQKKKQNKSNAKAMTNINNNKQTKKNGKKNLTEPDVKEEDIDMED